MGDAAERECSLTSADNSTSVSPPQDEDLDDLQLPRLRLNAESRPLAETSPPIRPRSNASDYSINPKNTTLSNAKKIDNLSDSSMDSSIENGVVPSSLALSPRANLLANSLNASSLSIDEEKVVVEDNDDIIKVSPVTTQKEFLPESSSETDEMTGECCSGNGVQVSFASEPEPGAVVEPMPRTDSTNLPLISPGNLFN